MRFPRQIPRLLCLSFCLTAPLFTGTLLSATFGTVVAPPGGASYSDIVLDEARTRLYLVNTLLNRVEIYNYRTKTFLAAIPTDAQPVSAALSRDGKFLYVTAYQPPILDIIDLTLGQIPGNGRISMPSNPEGVAVGADGRVLITAVPTTGTANSLLIYDPSPGAVNSIANVPVVPPPSASPVLPPPSGRAFASYRSRLLATPDGKRIIGVNGNTATTKVVFVYESASGTVLRSRQVANLSTVLSVTADGSKFMAGFTLFDTATLQVIAQENTANAPFIFTTATNASGTATFNTQANQGGSVFSPDGTVLYAAFNTSPLLATNPNVKELLINDPDNLLIQMGLQLPENLAGKMVIESSGANVYAISDSGFIVLPVSAINQQPIAVPQSNSVLLTNDICGVFKGTSLSDVFTNAGKGQFSLNLTNIPSLGGGGPGFGPGGGFFGPTITVAAPSFSVGNVSGSPAATFRFNPSNAVSPGTAGPANFVVTSPEAINIPATLHVYQNNRDSISSGTILQVPINGTTTEGLTDMVLDSARQRLYLANSGLNRIEILDLKTRTLLTPIKVGQLPHAMAVTSDGNTMYVANTGGESISIVDLVKGVQTGRVQFPAFPFNAATTIANPVAIAMSGRGPQFIMSDGTFWKIDNNLAIPRQLNTEIFGTAKTITGGNPSQWTMAATPGGEYIMIVNGSGTAWLYDYTADDITITKQVLSGVAGYIGPVTAGPQGRYYSVGGTFLNASLTPVQGGTNGLTVANRLVPAVTAVSANQVALFTLPVRTGVNTVASDAGLVELYDPATGVSAGNGGTIEGAPTTIFGSTRTSAFARTMAYDPASGTAYLISTSGISIVKITTGPAGGGTSLKPTVNAGGILSAGDNSPGLAPGEIVSIFGKNFGNGATATPPLPTVLGGVCVTLNNSPIPLSMAASGQINGQIPVTLAAGRYPLVIRSIDNQAISSTSTVTISKYAPAVMVGSDGQAAIMHTNGKFVNLNSPAKRDETLYIYATGLGVTHGATVTTGNAAPASPAATTDAVQVFFGNPLYKQAAMIVRSSVLVPGMIGVAQITITVPGFHQTGAAVPVTLKIGGVSSSTTGPLAPYVSVN